MEPLVTILWGHSLVSALRDSWAICVIMVKFTQLLIRFIIEDNCNVSNCFSFIKERNILACFPCLALLGIESYLSTIATVINCSFL